MNIHESQMYAHRAAANVTDQLSRAGLAEKFAEAAALFTGTSTGLATAATGRGVCLDSGVEALLELLTTVATDVAAKLANADVFMSCDERDANDYYKAVRDDEYTTSQPVLLTRGELADRDAAAYQAGLAHRQLAPA